MSGSVFRTFSTSSTTLRVALIEDPCGRVEIDEKLGPIRAREELLLHELHAAERGDEQRHSGGDHGVPQAQHAIEKGVESAGKARRLMAAGFMIFWKNDTRRAAA